MFWFNIIALFGLLVGFAGGWANLKGMRTAPKDLKSLIAWDQPPAAWRYEGFSNLIILLHSAGVFLLGLLLLVVFNLAGRVPPIPMLGFKADSISLLILGGMAVLQAGYGMGPGLAYPLATNLIRPVPLAVTETGIRYGKMDLPWSRYSHYETEAGTGVMLLYSSYCPEIVTGVLIPSPEISLAVTDYVRRALPSQPPSATPWARSKTMLFAGMTGLVLVFIVPGLLLVSVPSAWVYYPVAVWLLQMAGVQLIKKFDSGGAAIKDQMAG